MAKTSWSRVEPSSLRTTGGGEINDTDPPRSLAALRATIRAPNPVESTKVTSARSMTTWRDSEPGRPNSLGSGVGPAHCSSTPWEGRQPAVARSDPPVNVEPSVSLVKRLPLASERWRVERLRDEMEPALASALAMPWRRALRRGRAESSKPAAASSYPDWYPKRRCALRRAPRCVTHNITAYSSVGRLSIASSRETLRRSLHAHRLLVPLTSRPGSDESRSRCPGLSLAHRLPTCGSLVACVVRTPLGGSGSRRDCSARSSGALLTRTLGRPGGGRWTRESSGS
jgi:hypothetical protein